jgi:hypothetical protein
MHQSKGNRALKILHWLVRERETSLWFVLVSIFTEPSSSSFPPCEGVKAVEVFWFRGSEIRHHRSARQLIHGRMQLPEMSLIAFRHCHHFNFLLEGRFCGYYVVENVWNHAWTGQEVNILSQEAYSRDWVLSQSQAWCCTCSLAPHQRGQNLWPPHPFLLKLPTAWTSLQDHVQLSASPLTSHGHFLPRFCDKVSQYSLSYNFPFFSSLHHISVSYNIPSLKMAPCYKTPR